MTKLKTTVALVMLLATRQPWVDHLIGVRLVDARKSTVAVVR